MDYGIGQRFNAVILAGGVSFCGCGPNGSIEQLHRDVAAVSIYSCALDQCVSYSCRNAITLKSQFKIRMG